MVTCCSDIPSEGTFHELRDCFWCELFVYLLCQTKKKNVRTSMSTEICIHFLFWGNICWDYHGGACYQWQRKVWKRTNRTQAKSENKEHPASSVHTGLLVLIFTAFIVQNRHETFIKPLHLHCCCVHSMQLSTDQLWLSQKEDME